MLEPLSTAIGPPSAPRERPLARGPLSAPEVGKRVRGQRSEVNCGPLSSNGAHLDSSWGPLDSDRDPFVSNALFFDSNGPLESFRAPLSSDGAPRHCWGRLLTAIGAPCVPQVQLPRFDGNPRDWPRWIGLFRTLMHDQKSLSQAEKMAHLQSSVTGLARQLIEGMLFDGSYYQAALETLMKRFGRECDIVQANLAAVFNAAPVRDMDVNSLERYHAAVHCAVKVLQNMAFTGDLHSTENLGRAVIKLPDGLKREWGKAVVEMEPARPSLIDFDDWLDKQVRISLNSMDRRPATCDQRRAPPRSSGTRRVPGQLSSAVSGARAVNQASIMTATSRSRASNGGTQQESHVQPGQWTSPAACACD